MRPLDADIRHNLIRAVAVLSWAAALVLTVLRISETIGAQWGSLVVLCIGTGVASVLSLLTSNQSDTFIHVFNTGLRAATALQANVVGVAAVVEVDFDGIIVQVEHPEVIHWDKQSLIGRPLHTALIPERFRPMHEKGFQRFREAGEARVAGATINVPVLGQDGQEHAMRLTVARLGGIFVGTLVPTTTPIA
ncbi:MULTISPECIES: hypothetical protein [Streptomyces]|uniref:hypothetical protein n=1 Tax=Streptomyces TaxID=1883 RepID=UPI0034145D6C